MKYRVSNDKAVLSLSRSEWEKIGATTGWGRIVMAQQIPYVKYRVMDTETDMEFGELSFPSNAQPGQVGYFYQEFFKDASGMPKKEMVSPNGRYKAILINDGGLSHANTNQE